MILLDPNLFGLFLAAGLALNFTPGPDMLFVIASGTAGGRTAGTRAALGIGAGAIVHTVAATAGLSAILASSALAFSVVKYAGAAYLVIIGLRALFARRAAIAAEAPAPEPSHERRVFVRAVVTNILNPKVALFYLAFVPQFVDAKLGHVSLQFLLLGLAFATTGTLVNLGVGLASGSIGRWLARRSGFKRTLDRVTGGIFVALGVRLALAEQK